MKMLHLHLNLRLVLLVLAIGLSAGSLRMFGGRPSWPPPKHSAEYRQANLLFLQFQEALGTARWEDALALCSERVRKSAAEYPSAKAFFNETMPVDLLLAQTFGYWTLRSSAPLKDDGSPVDKADFYGLFVPLTAPGTNPVLQWHWGISQTNNKWVVDYPPVKLQEYVAKKKAAIQERDNHLAEIRRTLETKVKGITTRVVPLSERFVVGAPMLFRVEVTNAGESAVDYVDSGVAHSPLKVLNEQGQPLPATELNLQIMVRKGRLAPGATAALADKIDLNDRYTITNPGKYVVQFSGTNFQLGQTLQSFTGETPGLFGEKSESMAAIEFVGVTNRFPSEPITIEVIAGRK